MFGQQPQQQQPLGSSLFASKPAATGGGLFGGQPAAPATSQPGGLFGSTLGQSTGTNFGGGSLFGASQQQQQQPQQSLVASVDQNAYGNNPLFSSTLPTSAAPQATPLNASDKIKPSLALPVRGTPKSSSRITRLRGFANSVSAGSVSPSVMSGFSPRASTTPGSPSGRASPMQMLPGLSNEGSILSPSAFVSRPSVKKLDRNRLMSESPSLEAQGKFKDTPAAAAASRVKVNFDPALELSAQERAATATPFSQRVMREVQPSPTRKVGGGGDAGQNRHHHAAVSNGLSTKVQLKEGDYYTRPSMDILDTMSTDELRSVPDFVVARKGHGQVEFNMPVDLTSVEGDILGDIVVIEDRACTVYGGEWEESKPPVGQGLNVPATVTLERCWPLDKATREPIKDPNHPRLKQHLKKLRNMPETSFVDYDPVKGSWTFKVEHFSRYGLVDSDDEDEEHGGEEEKGETMDEDDESVLPVAAARRRQRHQKVSDGSSEEDGEDAPPRKSLMGRGDEDMDSDGDYDDDDDMSAASSVGVDVYGAEQHRRQQQQQAATTRNRRRRRHSPEDGEYDSGIETDPENASRASTPRASAAATKSLRRHQHQHQQSQGGTLPRSLGLDPKRVAVMQTSFFHQPQPQQPQPRPAQQQQQPFSSSSAVVPPAVVSAPAAAGARSSQRPPREDLYRVGVSCQ
jgi:nuclear pore complex protein Nup98-Nup96